MKKCPHCHKPTTDKTRFPGSEWCNKCVEAILAEQEREANEHNHPQIFRA